MGFLIELGSRVKCKSTNFSGVVTSRSECLYGCNRYTVQPQVIDPAKEMKLPDAYAFDEDDLEFIETVVEKKLRNTGGPIEKIVR